MSFSRPLSQVPRGQGGAQLRYDPPCGFTFGVEARLVASQFEDDLNSLPLKGYWTVDALLGRSLNEWVGVFVAGENLGNAEYDVGRTPVRTVGPRRTVRGGLRVRLGSGGRP